MLVTGFRISGGTVLTKLSFFNLEENKTRNLELTLRKDLVPAPVLGKINNIEGFFNKIAGAGGRVNKKGTILAWLDPEKEPSRHFIADLLQKKTELDKWNGTIVLLFKTAKEKDLFTEKNTSGLPAKTKCAVASTGSMEEFLKALQRKGVTDLPVVTFINPAGEVIYFSEGYKIGIGDEIMVHLNPKK
jgi:hypothetical protein